jgi:peptidoglycan/LPS O-acetylase OafA/YrhL
VPEQVEAKPPRPNGDRLYLPELDGLRFIAFLMVFLFHQGVPSSIVASLAGKTVARCFRENGWVGVQLFFILSGYLITTLLLREEARFGKIDLKAFWIRRILRIWPLFYLTVAISFLILPGIEGGLFRSDGRRMIARHLPWFLGFAGNWSMAVLGPVATDAQSVLWSVCVEEQFYLFVPLVVAFVWPRLRIPLVILLIASAVGFRAWLAYSNANQTMIQWNSFAQADTLLSGVLLALCLRVEWRSRDDRGVGSSTAGMAEPGVDPPQSRLLKGRSWLFRWSGLAQRYGLNPPLFSSLPEKHSLTYEGGVGGGECLTPRSEEPPRSRKARWFAWLQWPIYTAVLWLFAQSNLGHGEAWRRTWDFVAIWAAGVAIIAVAVTVPGWLRFLLARPRLVWLGKISYGLYMYHEIAIWLKSKIADALGWFPFDGYILPALSLGLTIGMAWASYTWFESRFLRLKRAWTRVPSRPV